MTRSPFPLQWPEGVARKRYREDSKFDKGRGFIAARDGALYELDRMGASHIVITSNLPTNASGKPYIVGSGIRMTEDPGIAVWWVRRGTEHVIACDRWRSPVENMRAIEVTLQAIRGIARWGTTEMVERAFAGFAALPPGSGPDNVKPSEPAAMTWRERFGVNIPPWNDLPAQDLLAVVKSRYRELIKQAHPDRGGDPDLAAKLGAALAAAETELSR